MSVAIALPQFNILRFPRNEENREGLSVFPRGGAQLELKRRLSKSASLYKAGSGLMTLGDDALSGHALISKASGAPKWWLSGGIAAANCVAAYQPKGAASLAASYINLANPGTYDAAPGVAPTFDAATGYTFGSNRYLTTGIVPSDTSWSVLIQFSDVTGTGTLVGMYAGGAAWIVQISATMEIYNGKDYPSGYLSIAPVLTSGNYGFAGKTPYRNGVAESSLIPAGTGTFQEIYLAGYFNGSGPANRINCKMSAIAIYSSTLTPSQMLAVSTAMAAL